MQHVKIDFLNNIIEIYIYFIIQNGGGEEKKIVENFYETILLYRPWFFKVAN